MMKVKNLPKETKLTYVKVRLPDKALLAYRQYAGGEKEMWFVGEQTKEFWMSPDPRGAAKRRLFPMPKGVTLRQVLEWDVIEIMEAIREGVEGHRLPGSLVL